MTLSETLPTTNAVFNALAALCLVGGWIAVRAGRRRLHRALMLSAVASSSLFLVGYVTRMALTGTHRYPGTGWLRGLYLSVLGSHTLLAMGAAPLVLTTLWWALRRRRYDTHRRWGRVTLPVWLYVSVTGVVIYLMLYRLPTG